MRQWTYLYSEPNRNLRHRCREQACGYQRGSKGEWHGLGDWDWQILLLCIKQITNETDCIGQGSPLNALWPKWGGNPRKKGHMYTCI